MRLRCCESAPWIPAYLGVTRHGKHRAVYELLADKYNADIQKGWLGGIDLTPLLRSSAGSVKKLLKTTRRPDASTPTDDPYQVFGRRVTDWRRVVVIGGTGGDGSSGASGRCRDFFADRGALHHPARKKNF